MYPSRRQVVLGIASAAAASALPDCSGSGGNSSILPSPQATTYDVIIVGAGMAGISAARTATAYGAKALVLEAQNRVGGRAYTDTTTFGEIGFDLGAQFFQQCLNGNEMFEIAQNEGLTLLDASGPGPTTSLYSTFTIGTAEADAVNQGLFLKTVTDLKAAIVLNGAKIAAGLTPDVPVSAILSPLLQSEAWYTPALAQTVTGIVGGPNGSLLDLYVYTNSEPLPFAQPGSDFIVKSGMGTFVQSLAKGQPVILNAPVTAINTSGSLATVTAGGTTYQGKSVIVTCPTNYLAKSNTAAGIQFTPALPAAYLSAFAGLPLVPVYKALMGFKSSFPFNIPGIPLNNPPPLVSTSFSVVLPLSNSELSTFFPNFWGTNTVEFIADGDLAQTLDAAGNAGAATLLLSQLETTFPGATAAWDGRITGSNWMSNPYFGGAFSAAVPGQVPARAQIAKPIGNLWFAGEAASTGGDRGLLLAAYRTGAAAATGALRQLGIAAHKAK